MKICGIYKITSPSNRIYIGQSINILNRWDEYRKYECKSQPLLYNSLKKYGAESHTFEIICQCDRSELNNLEKYYIALFQCFNTKHGLNLKSGSDKWCVVSDETRNRMSKSRIGIKTKPCSEERKRKISEANTGCKPSSLAIENSVRSRKLNRRSEESNKKTSESLKGKNTWMNKRVIDESTGIIYESAKIASKVAGINDGTFQNMLNIKNPQKNRTTFKYI